MGRAALAGLSDINCIIAIAVSFVLATTAFAGASEKWYYSGTVTIYHHNPPKVEAKPVSGFVEAATEGAAMLAAKNAAESKYRGQGDLVTANVVVKKWDKDTPPPDDKPKVETPNDPIRGADQALGATGGGGNPRRLVIPAGVKIRGVKVFAGRRVDGFHFLGSDSKWYGFKGNGNPEPKEIRFADDEHLVGFRGVYGDQWDRVWVITNRKEYGPFGGGGGKAEFKITVPEGQEIIGMHGRTGQVIDRAGLVTEPKK